jgi:uncharacterized delta-60 repeat protein
MSDNKSRTKVFTVALALTTSVFAGASSVGAQTLTLPSVTPPIVPAGQDGELDHTFGANDGDGIDGHVEKGNNFIFQFNTFGNSIEIQSDGKILSASLVQRNLEEVTTNVDEDQVEIATSSIMESFIERRNFDGTLDTTFGVNGEVQIINGIDDEILVASIAIQKDGKVLVAGVINLFSEEVSSTFMTRLLSNGEVDTTFGDEGTVIIDRDPQDFGIPTEVFVQRDGKIILAGYLLVQYQNASSQALVTATSDEIQVQATSPKTYFISRFLPDGSPDLSFATNGNKIGNLGESEDYISKIFEQSDGRLVFGGLRYEAGTREQLRFLMRLTHNGTEDVNYGDGGTLFFSDTGTSTEFDGVVMQADNKIIQTLSVLDEVGTTSTVVKRINVDGSIDTTFGQNGSIVIGNASVSSFLLYADLQADGKIVFAGATIDETGEYFNLLVVRLHNDGSLDNSFGTGGQILFNDWPNLVGYDVLIQPNGQILIAGFDIADDELNEFLIRLNSAKPVSVNGVTPSRLFDTRVGSPQGTISVEKTTYGESKELRIKVAGASGLPEFGIGAATINLTVTEPEATGYITVYPCDTRPLASNLTFVKNQTVSTAVTTAVSPTGEICVYSSAKTNLIADINAWSAPNAGYEPISPQRLLDTRALSPQGAISVVKKKYGADSELRVKVAGAAGLPGARIGSVSLNVTVTEPENEGFLTVYPCGNRPLASNLNFYAGQTVSTSVISKVSVEGEVCIYSSSPTNLIADAYGWFVEGSGVTPVNPTRLVDTRATPPQGAISVTKKKYGAASELRLPLNGVAELPASGISTVQLTVTVTNPSASGFITVHPCGTLPLASNLNYIADQTIATAVTAQVSTDGEVCIYSNQLTDIIVDINGWGN